MTDSLKMKERFEQLRDFCKDKHITIITPSHNKPAVKTADLVSLSGVIRQQTNTPTLEIIKNKPLTNIGMRGSYVLGNLTIDSFNLTALCLNL